MSKLYVEFLCTDSDFKKVITATNLFEVPEDAYAFRFVEEEDCGQDFEAVVSATDLTYLGRIYTIENALKEFPDDPVLKRFAESKTFTNLVKTRLGYWLPCKDGNNIDI